MKNITRQINDISINSSREVFRRPFKRNRLKKVRVIVIPLVINRLSLETHTNLKYPIRFQLRNIVNQ